MINWMDYPLGMSTETEAIEFCLPAAGAETGDAADALIQSFGIKARARNVLIDRHMAEPGLRSSTIARVEKVTGLGATALLPPI
jgi:hypothetical protein